MKYISCNIQSNNQKITDENGIFSSEDYVVLTGSGTIKEMRRDIRELLHNKDVLGACKFCPGRSLADPQITPAIQVRKPISYDKHI